MEDFKFKLHQKVTILDGSFNGVIDMLGYARSDTDTPRKLYCVEWFSNQAEHCSRWFYEYELAAGA